MDPPPPPPPRPPPPPPRPNEVTRLLSSYIDHIDYISRLLSSLLSALNTARSLYQPLHQLLQIPDDRSPPPQSDQVFFDAFLEFNSFETNPFPDSNSDKLVEMQKRLFQLRYHLHRHLRRLHRTHPRSLFPHYAIRDTLDYISTLFSPPNDQFPAKFTKHINTAAMESYVVSDTLSPINSLAAILHTGVETDRQLIKIGLEMGREGTNVIEEVVKQLRKNLPNFLDRMKDLEDHLNLCLATLDGAKSRLRQEMRRPR